LTIKLRAIKPEDRPFLFFNVDPQQKKSNIQGEKGVLQTLPFRKCVNSSPRDTSIRLNAMLQAVELPAGISHLNSRLTCTHKQVSNKKRAAR
jgi:hypothetical protein